MMIKLLVLDIFKLSTGTTVFACEGEKLLQPINGGIGTLFLGDEIRQRITFIGEREMQTQSPHNRSLALETLDPIQLSVSEAQSRLWSLLIDVN